ncbi:MAG: hypothetical protein JOY98_04795, partial [Candidatus Eremiobacteraeota bacterium]|nr:hypothetical protein [Candidatus Eremiobacteraeota bacterium]
METRETKTPTPSRSPNGASAPVHDDEVEVDSGAARRGRRGPSGVTRQILIVGGIIVALIVLFYGVRFIAYATTHQSTDDAYVEADLVTVTSKIAEKVDAINTDTNRYVNKGDLLI